MKYITVTDKKLKCDDRLLSNLFHEKLRVLNYDNDCCILVTGKEGSGKTTFAGYLAYLMGWDKVRNASNFNSVDWIVFNIDQLREAMKKAGKGQVIIIDEFVLMALSSDALTSMQKDLVKEFTLARSKNLIYIMIIPSVFMLGYYFAIHRTRVLFHVYSPNDLIRGFFRLYNFDEKAYLYNVFKKTKEYKYSKYSYDGRYFLNSLSQVGIDEKKYKEKKQEALDSLSEDQQKTNKTIIALSRLVDYIREIKPDLTIKELIEVAKLPIGYQYLRNVLSRAKTETEHEDFKEVKTLKLVMPHEAKIEK